MNPMHRRLTASAAAVALALTLAACSGSAGGGEGPTTEQGTQSSEVAHNDADIQFAQLMIMHHQGAVEMSELAVEQASDAEVRALAQRIQDAQGPEIELMTGWLESWGEDTSHDMGMDGMSQAEVMDELGGLDGSAFDRTFLERMVAHHRGAIEMAQEEKDEGSNPDALALADAIITAQTAEIAEMEDLLAGL